MRTKRIDESNSLRKVQREKLLSLKRVCNYIEPIADTDDSSNIEAIDDIEVLADQDQAVPPLIPLYVDQYHFIPIERAPRANITKDHIDFCIRFQNNLAINYNNYLTFQTERLQVELRLFMNLLTSRFLSSV